MLVPPSGVCGWGPTVDKFRCDDLPPGSYRLRFSQGPTPEQSSQEGILIAEVKNKNTEATIRLSLSPGVAATPKTVDISKTGSLQLERICQTSSADSKLRTTARGKIWFTYDDWSSSPCSAQKFNLAPGRYEIATYEDAFSERHRSRPSKILDLLEQRAVTVTIRDKATTRIVLPVWTAKNMIDMALSSLRKEAQEQDSKAIGYRPQ